MNLSIVSKLTHVVNTLPDAWPAAYLLGRVHYQRGDYTSALQILETVAENTEARDLIKEIKELMPGASLIKTMKGTKDPYPWAHQCGCLTRWAKNTYWWGPDYKTVGYFKREVFTYN